MSIQHRARIKTVADYSQYLSDMGGCCPNEPNADGEYIPFSSTYQNCVSENGYFIAGEGPWQCPEISMKGCCCSCSFVENFQEFFNKSGCDGECQGEGGDYSYDYCYDGGLKEVTECECNAVGGAWAGAGSSCSDYQEGGILNAYGLCNYAGVDVRWPGACCTESGCLNACSVTSCGELASGDVNPPTFYEFFICNDDSVCDRDSANLYCEDELAMRAGNSDRSGVNVVSERNTQELNQVRNNIIQRGLEYDSSCIYKEENQWICSDKSETSCKKLNGAWAGLDSSGFPYSCDSSMSSELKDYMSNNRSISSSVAGTWEVGKSYLGQSARFAGRIYSAGMNRGKGSEYWGNTKTGPADTRMINKGSDISSEAEYAVFVHNTNTNVSHANVPFYLNKISDKNFKYIIPDLYTLGWLYNAVNSPEFKLNSEERHNHNVNWLPFRKDYYLSSNRLKIAGEPQPNYIHIQNMDTGFTSTCESAMEKWAKAILLIRIKE